MKIFYFYIELIVETGSMAVIKVLFVCLGNICRSPLAEGVFKKIVEEHGLATSFKIDSCGTSAYHVGESADSRMMDVAYSHEVLLTSRARQFQQSDLVNFDYIIPMDQANYDSIIMNEFKSKVFLLREFDVSSNNTKDVPDPYYGGIDGFENVYQIVYRSCKELFKKIKNENQL